MSIIRYCIIILILIACGSVQNDDRSSFDQTQSDIDSLYLYYLKTAQNFIKNTNDSLAIIYYDSAIALKPSDGVINDRAAAKEGVGDLEGALKDFDLAINMSGEKGMYHLNKAYVLMELGREKEAMSILDNDLKKRKDTASYLFDKSYFMKIKKDLDSFEKLMNQLIMQYPNSTRSIMARYNHISLLLELKDTTKACEILQNLELDEETRSAFSVIDCSNF